MGEERATGPEIMMVETQDWSEGYPQPAPPIWRVGLGGYYVDFESEQAARNWFDAIISYGKANATDSGHG